jgi:hypothetical protein
MINAPGPREIEIAGKRVERLTAEFTRKRTTSAVLSAVFVLLGILAFAYLQPMLAFNLLMVALIFAIRCFDNHTMVQEVGRRSRKTLFVRMPNREQSESTKLWKNRTIEGKGESGSPGTA